MLSDAAKRAGVPMDSDLKEYTVKIPDVDWEFPVVKAFQAIEAAAVWHEKVGRMLCGIHAWY